MRVRVRDDVAKSKIVERASSRDRTKAREGLLRTATGSLQPDLPAKSSQLSLSQKSELVTGMSLGVPSKRHQLGRC